jgi:uncharacterized protein YjbJ (UPF0337 family)
MSWTQDGIWNTICDKIRRTWGKLSEDDLVAIAGQRQQLTTCLQTRYELETGEAEKRVEHFVQELKVKPASMHSDRSPSPR